MLCVENLPREIYFRLKRLTRDPNVHDDYGRNFVQADVIGAALIAFDEMHKQSPPEALGLLKSVHDMRVRAKAQRLHHSRKPTTNAGLAGDPNGAEDISSGAPASATGTE